MIRLAEIGVIQAEFGKDKAPEFIFARTTLRRILRRQEPMDQMDAMFLGRLTRPGHLPAQVSAIIKKRNTITANHVIAPPFLRAALLA